MIVRCATKALGTIQRLLWFCHDLGSDMFTHLCAVLCCAVLPSGPVERQVQDIKLGPAAVAARRPSTEAVPAVSGLSAGPSPRPAAEEPCNCSGAVQHTDDSCRVSCSSSSDVTPPLTERRAGMQQALPAVKAKIIELVRPMRGASAMQAAAALGQTWHLNMCRQHSHDATQNLQGL